MIHDSVLQIPPVAGAGGLVCPRLMGTVSGVAVLKGCQSESVVYVRRLAESAKVAAIPLTLSFLIVVGIVGGVLRESEVGAIAAVWSIVLAVILYRTVRLGTLMHALLVAGKRSAMLMFIIATFGIMG